MRETAGKSGKQIERCVIASFQAAEAASGYQFRPEWVTDEGFPDRSLREQISESREKVHACPKGTPAGRAYLP
jgi:hypothetical protein